MITEEELRATPMSTQLVPMIDEKNPNTFAVLFRFPTGRNQVWYLQAPDTPIDERWIKAAMVAILKKIMEDLRGWNPDMKPDIDALDRTNWESVTGGLRKLIGDWAQLRIAHYRAMAAPEAHQ